MTAIDSWEDLHQPKSGERNAPADARHNQTDRRRSTGRAHEMGL